ncbi:MAG TPA: hypothetical protein ACFYEK_12840, partial [Candidatus Wunengus sp. YC60]
LISLSEDYTIIKWQFKHVVSTHRVFCIIRGRRGKTAIFEAKKAVSPCIYCIGKTTFIEPIRN